MSRLKFVKRRLTLPHPTSTPVVLLIIACTRRAFASPITDPWALATGWQTSLALSQDWLAIEHYDRCVEMLVQPEDTPIGRVCMRSIGEVSGSLCRERREHIYMSSS